MFLIAINTILCMDEQQVSKWMNWDGPLRLSILYNFHLNNLRGGDGSHFDVHHQFLFHNNKKLEIMGN
jgi:hypothetical protein